VRTEDIASFGQLYLQKGRWNGRQLLPAAWIDLATSRQVSNGSSPTSDWNQGYGFQFWRCRHNAYRGDGAFGQYCIVMPDQDAVIAITSGIGDMQQVLNLVWDKFLPACQPRKTRSNPEAHTQLRNRLAALKLPPAPGSPSSPIASRVLNRPYTFPANDQNLDRITLRSNDAGQSLTLSVRIDGQELVLPAGHQQWHTGRAPLPAGRLAQFPNEPIASTFGWTAEDTLEIRVCAYETPFVISFRLKFDREQVTLDREANVAFGSRKQATLTGRAEPAPSR
jgi:hypothetical protein